MTNNDLQNTTQKTTDLETRTPLKPGGELRFSEVQAVPAPHAVSLKYESRYFYPTINGYMFLSTFQLEPR